jgi:hypothetical protein
LSDAKLGDEIEVFSHTTNKGSKAKVIGISIDHDLALLKTKNAAVTTVILGEADGELIAEDKLLIAGYPTYGEYSEAVPELASISVLFDGTTESQGTQRLQFKGNQVVPGLSGGPLLSLHTGHVVGIVIETRGRLDAVGGWAVPSEALKTFIAGCKLQLLIDPENRRCWYRATDDCLEEGTSITSRQPTLRGANPDSQNLYYYGSRKIVFRDRKNELKVLNDFLNSQRKFAWFLVTGSGGVGKSRLCLELCLKRDPTWRAGFLDKSALPDLAFWRNWRPNRPTLIIVDYAAVYPETVGELARCLQTKRTRPDVMIRLLLIERDEREWLEKFLGRGSTDRELTLAAKYLDRAAGSMALGSLPDEDTWRIMRQIAPELPVRAKTAILGHVRKLDSEDRPLFAAFVAAAGDKQTQSRYSVLRDILRRERQTRWEPAGVTEPDLTLMTLATMCGGLPWNALPTDLPWINEAVQQLSLQRYETIVGSPAKATIPPLEPDILGGLFFLDRLKQLPPPQALRLVETAWATRPEGTLWFLVRLVPEFPDHESLSVALKPPDKLPEASRFWATLAATLMFQIPLQHFFLATSLYNDLTALTKLYPEDGNIFEDFFRATLNMLEIRVRARQFDEAQKVRTKLDQILASHPDQGHARKGHICVLAADVVRCAIENEIAAAGSVLPAPLTLVGPVDRMKSAQNKYDMLFQLFEEQGEPIDLRERVAGAAFHLVLGYTMVSLVAERVGVPGSILLSDVVIEEINLGAAAYRHFKSFAEKYTGDATIQIFLARSASALSAAYSRARDAKSTQKMCADIRTLASRFNEMPKIREELARSLYNLVFVLRHSDGMSAMQTLKEMSSLAQHFPEESILSEKENNAARLLH